jgi:hypothetical protein
MWKTMESAPKNTCVLLMCDGGVIVVGRFGKRALSLNNREFWYVSETDAVLGIPPEEVEDIIYQFSEDVLDKMCVFEPVLWMPLPEVMEKFWEGEKPVDDSTGKM